MNNLCDLFCKKYFGPKLCKILQWKANVRTRNSTTQTSTLMSNTTNDFYSYCTSASAPDTGSYLTNSHRHSRNPSQLSFNDDLGHLSLWPLNNLNNFEHRSSPVSPYQDVSHDWTANLNSSSCEDQYVNIPNPQLLIDVLVKSMSLKPEQVSDLHKIANVFPLLFSIADLYLAFSV